MWVETVHSDLVFIRATSCHCEEFDDVAIAHNLNNQASQQLHHELKKRANPLIALAIITVLLFATA